METGGTQHDGSIVERAVRDVAVRQYRLHELPHHSLHAVMQTASNLVVPMAHTPADIYKCLHQGEFGVGHSIDDPAVFGNNLAGELLQARPAAEEPVLEDVSPDGTVFRINLRPYRMRFQGDENAACALLLKACLDSAERVKGRAERFLAALAHFRDLNRARSVVADGMVIAFPPEPLDAFLLEVADFVRTYNTVPILSHSAEYKRFNNPSYRVLDLETLKESELAFLLPATG